MYHSVIAVPSDFIEAISASVSLLHVESGRSISVTECNDLFCEMLGVSKTAVIGRPLREFVPRYARTEFEANLLKCLETSSTTEFIQPIDLADKTKWWRVNSHPILGTGEEPSGILVTCIDITDKIGLEADLEVMNSRFSAVIESAYDGIVSVDSEMNIKIFNSSAEEMFGYDKQEVLGKHLSILIPARYHDHHQDHVDRFQSSPIQSRQMFERGGQITGITKDGYEFPVEISISKIVVNGAQEFTAVIRDVSERARLIEQLRQQAIVDQLTNLPNRRAFNERSGEYIKLAERRQSPLSVLMIDIDHFKTINDQYGHAVGDIVLKAMGAAGRSCLRESDFMARLGGEEFAMLLPDTDLEEAELTAERLRETVAGGQFAFDWPNGKGVPFTVSVGVSARDAGEMSIEDSLKRADLALYSAKRDGRNRVVVSRSHDRESAAT